MPLRALHFKCSGSADFAIPAGFVCWWTRQVSILRPPEKPGAPLGYGSMIWDEIALLGYVGVGRGVERMAGAVRVELTISGAKARRVIRYATLLRQGCRDLRIVGSGGWWSE